MTSVPAASVPPTLEGDRIRLRPCREDDLPAFFAMRSDPRLMRHGSHPPWTHIDEARTRFESNLHGNDSARQLYWAIADRADDRMIGDVALFHINAAQRMAEIGYMLQVASWGKGLAREATALALDHAFDGLGLRRIEADIDPRNLASCRLAERLGFVREGLLRERWEVAGEVCDTAFHGLLAKDWRAARDP
jgi:RimJ/RimL family protein N-acetyltransferase